MSLLASLLRDFSDDERVHLVGLIDNSFSAERAAVAAGASPRRAVDVGTRARRSGSRSVAPVQPGAHAA